MSHATRLEELLRELAPQVLGVLIHRTGDFDTAEDAVQEASLAAALHWPRDGIPDSPRSWLIQTAMRKMTDQIRSSRARRRREQEVARLEPPAAEVPGHDDTLTLLFLCCHPTLTPASAIALTLRAIAGLTTAQIARAFLVPENTMGQRISRAKQRLKASDVPFTMPTGEDHPQRLDSVLQVLYLLFNEGHTSSTGTGLHRADLSDEAIRLTRMPHSRLPDDSEVTGLLALMLLTDARRPARTGPNGELVPLDEQDRSRWNRPLITEGVALVTAAMSRGRICRYQLEASIAALHAQAPSARQTAWPQILAVYEALRRLSGNPIVTLNMAVAAAMVHGPAAGLTLLEPLDEQLGGHHRLDAVRGHLLEMLGDTHAAGTRYRAAADRTTSLPERRYLFAQAARLCG
ncbi:sigma-70 family RNA polymerase sigma factor [Micromonospora sp. CPCC 205546]|uniref:RNA polymerase sigma factor n=1 Tax=Micromonospora sp. CPCC 205546 TaxID=3122397 RepID=UPI002FEEEBA7